jgi:branched-chain amino acid transport system substrate-binding protein
MTHASRRLLMAALAATTVAAPAQAQTAPIAVKIGILSDMSGPYADAYGPGSLTAALLASEDAKIQLPNVTIEVISADHLNKPDVAAGIARRWLDVEGVDVVADMVNSAIGLAVQDIARERHKISIVAAGSSALSGKSCSPTGMTWTMDTYTYAKAATTGTVRAGGDTWFFITADYAGGHALQADTSAFVKAAGGTVIGSVRHPVNTHDFASFLLAAQSSHSKVIGLANVGNDMINSIKQANEFGIAAGGQVIAVPIIYITDIHALGLKTARGVRFGSPFYWDANDGTREFSRRFFDKMRKMPTDSQAGVYTSLMHYFKAVNAAGSKDATKVVAKMREIPINDFMTKNGKLRENGSVLRERTVYEVKAPEESKYDWDYLKVVQVLSAEDAAPRPVAESECNLAANN